jgi:hypothetical protein
MAAPGIVEIEWTFTPPDLFEERTEIDSARCSFTIESGRVAAQAPFAGGTPEELSTYCNEIHQRLDALFLAAQMLGHVPYTLSRPGPIKWLRPDGRVGTFAFPGGGLITFATGIVDVQTTDAAGKVITDTRRDRIAGRKSLAARAAAHIADDVANAILRSYSAAVNDPRNELVHLYEIREALSTRFGGEHPTRNVLGISAGDWSDLGRLACYEPILQGRHRGKNPGALRDATAAELATARKICREIVERYLAHLEGRAGP